jgi:hypothetical protein
VISSSASRAAVTGIRAVNFIGRIVSFKLGASLCLTEMRNYLTTFLGYRLIVMVYLQT